MKMMMKQYIKTKKSKIVKGTNDVLVEILNKSNSFKEQINR